MVILNPDADEEQQEEILSRIQQLVRDGGGTIEHVNDWGRRKISYPIAKHLDGRYVVITCTGEPSSLAEIERVLSISKDVVLRALFIGSTGTRPSGSAPADRRRRWTRTPRARAAPSAVAGAAGAAAAAAGAPARPEGHPCPPT